MGLLVHQAESNDAQGFKSQASFFGEEEKSGSRRCGRDVGRPAAGNEGILKDQPASTRLRTVFGT
ncbi:MAG: hypothetical protein CL923_04600 [Deltaproteobacteria bacterium]|jgi:hypothetical protein|nr:hypothetical protein [Deltaproteobacteria bacterium]MBQ31822.1 hypothetical protein [Deltaproteobacteria bacterium]